MSVESAMPAAPVRTGPSALPRCAEICRTLGEPLAGTAPAAARAWFLVEHPGPWPAFGLPKDIPQAVARFSERALTHGVRTQLVRRPERSGRRRENPVVMIAGGPPRGRWIEERIAADQDADSLGAALDALDPSGFAHSAPPGFGEPVEAALLVCTHGRREVCCAAFGRPVARALAEQYGDAVWETTHVGGDRFAASLVALPSGAYFGRLDPADALRVADSVLAGRIEPDKFRGRAGLPPSAQAAECFLRRALGEARVDAVSYLGAEQGGAGRRAERFAVRGSGVHTVALAERETRRPRLTSCGEGTVDRPTVFELVEITCGG